MSIDEENKKTLVDNPLVWTTIYRIIILLFVVYCCFGGKISRSFQDISLFIIPFSLFAICCYQLIKLRILKLPYYIIKYKRILAIFIIIYCIFNLPVIFAANIFGLCNFSINTPKITICSWFIQFLFCDFCYIWLLVKSILVLTQKKGQAPLSIKGTGD